MLYLKAVQREPLRHYAWQPVLQQSELVFVVTADNLIEGQEYKDAIIRAKELAKQGSIVALGVKPAKKIPISDIC